MKRTTVFALLLVMVLSACGPETLPAGDVAVERPVAAVQLQSTLVAEATQPVETVAVLESTATATSVPFPTPTLPLTDAVPIWGAEPYRVPVPDMDLTTVPELDDIRFVNPRLLPLAKEKHQSVSTFSEAWMLDDGTVLLSLPGEKPISNEYYANDLYLWNPHTNQAELWLENAQNLSWSANGEDLYYLSKRVNGNEVFFDLYRYNISLDQSELLRSDLGTPFVNQSPVVQPGPDDTLIVVDKEQPTLLRQQGDTMDTIPLLRLPETQPGIWHHSEISTSPNHQIAAVLFSSKDAHVIYLIDLKSLDVIAQFESDASLWTNVDWSVDSQRLVVADSTGVFYYEVVTGEKRYLVTREDLKFPPIIGFSGLMGSGADFVNPRWSPDQKVILFVARSGLWAPGPIERPGWEPLDVSNVSPTEIVFAVTSDGAYRRSLTRKSIPFNLSHDRSSSWINAWDQDIPISFLADIVWK